MAGLLAALAAMAGIWGWEVGIDLDLDSSTKTGCGVHLFSHLVGFEASEPSTIPQPARISALVSTLAASYLLTHAV